MWNVGNCDLKILVTGSKGFVGRNLVETLKCIRDKKKNDAGIIISDIYEYDVDSDKRDLEIYCRDCDFVFNLAGVNRPNNSEEYMDGNFGFASLLLETLKQNNNSCPVMISSSLQASLAGRFGDSEYGRSKLAGEKLLFDYASEMGVKVLVYRFPNLFGKWCRPNYNSAVATFCNAFANDLPYTVSDPSVELELLYIDDLIGEMILALGGSEHHCDYPKEGDVVNGILYDGLTPVGSNEGKFCYVPITHKATLGEIVCLLEEYKSQVKNLMFSPLPDNSFEKKLYSTYLSYLPKEKTIFDLKGSFDERGSFTEFFKSNSIGQFSINVSKPGQTKGQHWHHTKMEIFLVVSGHGLIQERQIGTDPKTGLLYPIREFEVSGDKLRCIYMLPGFTHNIINLSDTNDLVTLMWANEVFNPDHPDTYREEV